MTEDVLQILILEDCASDAELTIAALRRAGVLAKITVVDHEAAFIAALEGQSFDAILSDYSLPQYNAVLALEQVRALKLDTPFIVVTGATGEDVVTDVMKQGACDYLLKDRLSRLGQAVIQAVAQSRLRARERASAEALRRSEERLVLAQRAANIGTFELHFASGTLAWTDGMEALYGLEAGSFDGRLETWQALIHPDDRERVEKAYYASLKAVQELRLEFRICRPDGSLRWISLAAKVHGKDQRAERVIGINLDVTQVREAEAERDCLLEREQSARAEAERLYEEAQRANRLKDEFLATLSHELRTPLTAILGWTELLRNHEVAADESEHAFEILERNAKAQVQIIDDLLDVSRVITGKLELKAAAVCLPKIAKAAIDSLALAAKAKGVKVQFSQDHELPAIYGDANRLKQVAWNLLSNAIKFTPSGGKVSVRVQKNQDHAIELVVQDSGEGISPNFLPFVFDRFRQEDGTSTRRHGGLGLGLAIVRHITEAHGGCLSVTSAGRGHGATFCIAFAPMDQAGEGKTTQLPCPELEAKTKAQPGLVAQALSGVEVLVVDDNEDMRHLAKAVLERQGARVSLSDSVDDALGQIKQQQPDVLLCDISMPHDDGFALMRQLRKLQEQQASLRKMKTAALTAHASAQDRASILASGFQAHIAKPLDTKHLVAVVTALAKPSEQAGPKLA